MPTFDEMVAHVLGGVAGRGVNAPPPPEASDVDSYRNIARRADADRRMRDHEQMMQLLNMNVFDTVMGAPRKIRTAAKEPEAAPIAAGSAELTEDFAAEYRALAAELGLNTAPVDVERFKTWLAENGVALYPRADVDEYLHFKYQVPVGNITQRVHWGWRPLREADRVHGHAHDAKNGVLQRGVTPYSKPIPYPVLMTVKAIRDDFPAARFFVSDEMEAERIPDPFLLVELGGELFIVERWDEPSFRSKK